MAIYLHVSPNDMCSATVQHSKRSASSSRIGSNIHSNGIEADDWAKDFCAVSS